MKHLKNELDVDYIGGMGSLTADEEKAISKYLKQQTKTKSKSSVSSIRDVQKPHSSVK